MVEQSLVAGYARVSTIEQTKESSLEQQIDRLQRAGAEIIYTDTKSGRTSNREQFKEMLKVVQENRISEIIITRVDRLSRSLQDLLKTVELLEKHNVKLRVLDSPVDTTTAFGRMSLNQISAIAQFESELLSDRVKHGTSYARSQKKSFKAIFGYIRTKEGYLEFDQRINEKSGLKNCDVAKNIVELLCNNPLRSCSRIIFETYDMKFTITGLRKWFANPTLRGHTHYWYFQDKQLYYKDKDIEPVLHYNTHPAILSEEQFARINQNLIHNKTFRGLSPNKRKYPLASLVKCATCGSSFVREFNKTSKARTEYLRCGRHSRGNHFCPNKKYVPLKKINNFVIENIIVHSQKIITLALGKSTKEDVTTESTEILELREQLNDLLKMNSKNPAIIAAITDFEAQISNAVARAKTTPVKPAEDTLALIHNASSTAFWESLDDDLTQEVFRELISKVIVDEHGNASVEFKF